MTQTEVDFLERHLRADDVVWEWGAGHSTPWLASICRRVTAVEHDRMWAATVLTALPRNASLLYVPADEYPVNDDEDGDMDAFKSYADVYQGRNVTVVLIDGRARPWCARRVAETAPYGPHEDMRIFVHDMGRPETDRIGAPADAPEPGWFDLVERVGTLGLFKARL